MTTPIVNRRADRFAQLLDESAGARRHHLRSPADPSLAPLVAIGERISRLQPRVDPDQDFRASLRAMLVATAERDGIGVTASDAESRPHGRLVEPRRPATAATGRSRKRSRKRTRAAIIVGIAAGTLTLSGMSAASGDAMPGDALYGIKRSTEKAQLALAPSSTDRGALYLEFAKTRVSEAHAIERDPGGLAGVLDDMDDETRQGVKLLTTAAVDQRHPAALDAVSRFVTVQRDSVSALLDRDTPGARERVLESLGLLDSVNRRTVALRTSLACSSVRRADALGPLPATCGTAIPPVGAQPADPALEQTRQTQPIAGPPRSEAPQPAPNPSAQPSQEMPGHAERGLLRKLGRFLGGILG